MQNPWWLSWIIKSADAVMQKAETHAKLNPTNTSDKRVFQKYLRNWKGNILSDVSHSALHQKRAKNFYQVFFLPKWQKFHANYFYHLVTRIKNCLLHILRNFFSLEKVFFKFLRNVSQPFWLWKPFWKKLIFVVTRGFEEQVLSFTIIITKVILKFFFVPASQWRLRARMQQ